MSSTTTTTTTSASSSSQVAEGLASVERGYSTQQSSSDTSSQSSLLSDSSAPSTSASLALSSSANTSSLVVLPTTSNNNSVAESYECYRQIGERLEFEPESKRIKLTSGSQIVSLKESQDTGGGGSGEGGGGGRYDGGLSNIYMVHKKLEERIGGILCCTVCLDLPKTAIYQCTNGHLMCAGCFSHLLADARLKDEQATCPNCRCEISKTSCCRNLAVEKTLSELPASCAYCQVMLARHCLEHHQRSECYERPTKCVYECIGCTWERPYHELEAHAQQCAHPNRPAREVVNFLQQKDSETEQDQNAMAQLVNFLSLEKVSFNDLQFKQYKTDEITPKLYFETNRFNAFFHQWVLKARVNDNMKSPNLTSNRFISFQLILKSKLTGTPPSLDVKFCVLRGPFGEVPINARVHSFEFNSNKIETEYIRLSINPEDCNKLLASKTINFRFFMFQS